MTTEPTTDEKIAQYEIGYQIEAQRRSRTATQRQAASTDELEKADSQHLNGAVCATTFHASYSDDGYEPNERLPDCEGYSTKGQKYSRLFSLNSGRDGHVADGHSESDDSLHKSDRMARYRRRLTETVAQRLGVTDLCKNTAISQAVKTDTRAYNRWGGIEAAVIAFIFAAAIQLGEQARINRDALNDFIEDWNMPVRRLPKAISKALRDSNDDDGDTSIMTTVDDRRRSVSA
jgi:hypothetical protein